MGLFARNRVPILSLVMALTFLPVSQAVGRTVGDLTGTGRARWRTIHSQGFEGTFPAGAWLVTDYNGPDTGGYHLWDDVTGGYESTYAAHPNGSTTYGNLMDTSMRYGPFSLAGARDAEVTFRHWLDSEDTYDFFSWSFACNGTDGPWKTTELSGAIAE